MSMESDRILDHYRAERARYQLDPDQIDAIQEAKLRIWLADDARIEKNMLWASRGPAVAGTSTIHPASEARRRPGLPRKGQ